MNEGGSGLRQLQAARAHAVAPQAGRRLALYHEMARVIEREAEASFLHDKARLCLVR